MKIQTQTLIWNVLNPFPSILFPNSQQLAAKHCMQKQKKKKNAITTPYVIKILLSISDFILQSQEVSNSKVLHKLGKFRRLLIVDLYETIAVAVPSETGQERVEPNSDRYYVINNFHSFLFLLDFRQQSCIHFQITTAISDTVIVC